MPTVSEATKPVNAGWQAKMVIDPATGDIKLHAGEGLPLEVVWYPNGRIKITISEGTPMQIRQAYLRGPSGQDVIVELAPDAE
jgi:hypothetical protein